MVSSVWADLPRPRPPTIGERAVLEALVAEADCPPLAEQLATVTVTGTCACGCSSIRLATDGPALTAAQVAALSTLGRDDWVSVNATAGDVGVVLHVLQGRMHELELFAGEGVPVEPPKDLGLVWIS